MVRHSKETEDVPVQKLCGVAKRRTKGNVVDSMHVWQNEHFRNCSQLKHCSSCCAAAYPRISSCEYVNEYLPADVSALKYSIVYDLLVLL